MLTGTYNYTMDAKGRLNIPSKLRDDLGSSFMITRNQEKCLSLYPMPEWDKFKEKMDRLPRISSEPARRLRRFYFGNCENAEMDKQGRLLVSQPLRTFAGLSKEVTLVGVDDHVEIWDSAAWDIYNNGTDINDLMFDLGNIEL